METPRKAYTARFGKDGGGADCATVEDCLRAFLAGKARSCSVTEWTETGDGMMVHKFGDWSGRFNREQARQYLSGQAVLVA